MAISQIILATISGLILLFVILIFLLVRWLNKVNPSLKDIFINDQENQENYSREQEEDQN